MPYACYVGSIMGPISKGNSYKIIQNSQNFAIYSEISIQNCTNFLQKWMEKAPSHNAWINHWLLIVWSFHHLVVFFMCGGCYLVMTFSKAWDLFPVHHHVTLYCLVDHVFLIRQMGHIYYYPLPPRRYHLLVQSLAFIFTF